MLNDEALVAALLEVERRARGRGGAGTPPRGSSRWSRPRS